MNTKYARCCGKCGKTTLRDGPTNIEWRCYRCHYVNMVFGKVNGLIYDLDSPYWAEGLPETEIDGPTLLELQRDARIDETKADVLSYVGPVAEHDLPRMGAGMWVWDEPAPFS